MLGERLDVGEELRGLPQLRRALPLQRQVVHRHELELAPAQSQVRSGLGGERVLVAAPPQVRHQRGRHGCEHGGVRRSGDRGGDPEVEPFEDERRRDRPRFEQVRVVAHLPQLHQDVHHAEEVSAGERGPGGGPGHELLVQVQLALRQPARDDVLELAGQLLLDVPLQAAQQEGPHDAVQPGDQLVVHGAVALHHAGQRVAEPVRELLPGAEDVRHEEVHERPQLHEVVLQRRAREQQAALRVEVEQRLPALGLEVLDVVRLVQDHVVPPLPPECARVLHDQLVGGDADVVAVGLGPARPQALARLGRAEVRQHLEDRAEALQLGLPVDEAAGGHDDQVRAPDAFHHGEIGQQADGLHGLAQPHLIRQDSVEASLLQRHQPVQPHLLVLPQHQRGRQGERPLHRDGAGGQVCGLEAAKGGVHVGIHSGLVAGAILRGSCIILRLGLFLLLLLFFLFLQMVALVQLHVAASSAALGTIVIVLVHLTVAGFSVRGGILGSEFFDGERAFRLQ